MRMPCLISCSISAFFLISMIYFNLSMLNNNIIAKYESQLPPDLQKIYHSIVEDRLKIYYFGYILGFILSCIIIFFYYQNKIKLNTFSLVCIVVSTSFLVNYFYYILSPKKDWMLNHIHSRDQNKAWLNMYSQMQKQYHNGLALGIFAIGFFTLAFRK